jgi:hypothetical protein
VQVDLEIENTLRRLREEARINTMVVATQQTLKELAAPNMENQPLCINIYNNTNFELKSRFIHLLPIFNGFAREDPLYSSQGVPHVLRWHETTWS